MTIVPIELPHVGESVVDGIIDKWLKKPGDKVEKYDSLVEVITDKVNMEVPSPYTGVLTRILVTEGTTVNMGSIIAEMETDDPSASVPSSEIANSQELSTMGVLMESNINLGPTGAAQAEDTPNQTSTESHGPSYSPVVTKLAQEYRVDLSQVSGTGFNGRVTKKDVLEFVRMGTRSSGPTIIESSVNTEEILELSPVKRMVANHMVESASQIPHAWAMTEVNLTNLVSLRKSIREGFRTEEGQDITILPFVIESVASSLKENPLLNSVWRDGNVVLKKEIHIGIAVSAPNGLVVPVIPKADSLTISAINRILRDLVDRARQIRLSLEDVQGGTFTVNNTGALGTSLTQPIINHPQAAIITTEAVQKRAIVIDDTIVVCPMMNMCLSFDHRIVDGFGAAKFLQSIKEKLETIGPDKSLR